jgi:hypothetical protein
VTAHALGRHDGDADPERGGDEQALEGACADPCRDEQPVAGGQHRDQVGQDEQQERARQDEPLVQPDRERGQ